MKRIFILLSALLFSPALWAGHQIEYRISPLGNLVYQLDCMAQVARFRCSQQDYKSLWQQEIKPHVDDQAMLDQWHALRSQMNETVMFDQAALPMMPVSPNFPVSANNSLNVLEQIRIMAFANANLKAYQTALETLLSPNHMTQEMQVLQHFWSRFEPWFQTKKPHLVTFVSQAEALSEKIDVNGLLTAMRSFYHSELPADLTLPVYLVAHPKAQANSSGLVFKQNSIIEVLDGEQAADRLAVVIHEIAHFYHEQAPIEHHLTVMNQFTDAASQTGKVGYYLYNEAMASAIGNGIVEQRIRAKDSWQRYLEYPMSFYADTGIDTASKSALPLVQSLIDASQAVDPAFLQALDAQWSRSLDALKNSPKERLRHVGIINLTTQSDALTNPLFGMIRPSSAQVVDNIDTSSDRWILKRYPMLDVVIMANDWEQLKPLNLKGLEIPEDQSEGTQLVTDEHGAMRIVMVSEQEAYFISAMEQMLSRDTF